jgi:Flp pilus assembly pilin Flp
MNRKAKPMMLWIKTVWQNNEGQDMIEYALLAATLVVVVAGVLPPTIMPSVSSIFSKISGLLSHAPH